MARVIADCANCGNTAVNELCEDCQKQQSKVGLSTSEKTKSIGLREIDSLIKELQDNHAPLDARELELLMLRALSAIQYEFNRLQ